jgi:hypothetical protein
MAQKKLMIYDPRDLERSSIDIVTLNLAKRSITKKIRTWGFTSIDTRA